MSACPRCGEENPRRARFCLACGRALGPEPASAAGDVRKTVTVLFADIKGSTGLGEQLDPESHRRVISRYFEEMRTAVERHGGIVEKFIGDAVMAVFGIPALHEDDALRAVRAAAEMRESLDRLNEELGRVWGLELAMRTGINTGEVVAGDPASGTLVTGDAVVVAKRLEESAAPGEIQLGPVTYRLVADCVEAEAVGAVTLKGKSAPVSAWRLVSVTAGAELPAVRLGSPLVGRDLELASLEQTFELAVADRSCRLFTVLGPAGIGKSRLTHEFIESLGERAQVVRGRCLPYGEGITFWPLVEVVKQEAGLTDRDSTETARAKIAALLPDDESAPVVCERIAAAIGRSETPAPTAETFWAVRMLLEALARERPLVAVFDDIQWAEETFLDLIEYLVGWSTGSRILLCCLARPELRDVRPSWGAPGKNAISILLGPLDEQESQQLMGNLVGGIPLPDSAKARITGAAEGNPLFVEEMLRMLVDDGLLHRENGSWVVSGDLSRLDVPPTIHALLASRIDRLDPDERTVLLRASVLGQVFWWSAVAELSSGTVSDVGRALQSLVRKELIRHERSAFTSEDAFRFAHILIRDAAYSALPKETRADLHERVATWLERKVGGRTAELVEIVAHHLEEAYRCRLALAPADEKAQTLAEAACTRLAAAGRAALARGDMPAAVNLLERAAALAPRGDVRRNELLEDLASALKDAGDLARANEVAAEALEGARLLGDPRAEARATVLTVFLGIFGDAQRSADALLESLDGARQVLERYGDDAGLARAWRTAALVHWLQCRSIPMTEALERALPHAERAGDARGRAAILSFLARAALIGPSPVGDAVARCEELLEQAEGDPVLRADVGTILAVLKAMLGRFDEARKLLADSKAIFEEMGHAVLRASLTIYAGLAELLAGDPAAAEQELRRGYDTLADQGERGFLSTTAALLARALHAQGRHDEALAFSEISEQAAAEDDRVSHVFWRGTRARLFALRRAFEEAEVLAREAVDLASGTDYLDLQADAQLDLADVLAAAGKVKEAAAHLDEAVSLYERKGNLAAIDGIRLRRETGGSGRSETLDSAREKR